MSKYLGFEPTSDSQSYCFVSYDSSDTERIIPIVSSLYKAGLDIWYDYGIECGENWSGRISNRIKNCNSVLMFLSSSTFLRENPFIVKFSLHLGHTKRPRLSSEAVKDK